MANTKIMLMAQSSILTDKAFYAKALGGVALIVTAFGLHPAWLSLESQAEIAGGIAMLAALGFQLFGGQGPVSLTAPLSTPDPVVLPSGTHTVTVAAPPPPLPPPPPVAVVTTHPAGAPVVVQDMPPPVVPPLAVPPPQPAPQGPQA